MSTPWEMSAFASQIEQVRAQRVAVALLAFIAFLGLLGGLQALEVPLHAFSLTGEWNVPALFSGGLLWGAAALAFANGSQTRVIGAFLAFMGLDELAVIHESLESWTGVDWQILYLPVILVGAIAWARTMPRLRPAPVIAWLWVGGAGAWFVAQVFEKLENHGNVLVHPWMTLPEETLEMAGSSLFGLALLLTLQTRMDQL
jgi:hypothetical protein